MSKRFIDMALTERQLAEIISDYLATVPFYAVVTLIYDIGNNLLLD